MRTSSITILLLILAIVPELLEAQSLPIMPGGGEAHRPEPKDPRYVPSLVPEYMQKKIDPRADFILAPEGIRDPARTMNEFILRQRTKKKGADRYDDREFSDEADTPADRRRFERSVLRQFGVDTVPYYEPHSEYRESAGRRFQIVFFLSLPFTLGLSYALAAVATNSVRGSVVLNGTETAIFVATGLALSAGIAWYDHTRWLEYREKKGIAPGEGGKPFPFAETGFERQESLQQEIARHPLEQREDRLFGFRMELPVRF